MKGEVVVKIHSDDPGRFAAGATILSGLSPETAHERTIERSRVSNQRVILGFVGVADRESAEALRGHLLFVESEDMRPLEAGSYWEHQLIGLAVQHVNGNVLGEMAEVLSRSEQDIWKISTPGGEVLMPAVKQIVVEVDLTRGLIVVDPPDGLFPDFAPDVAPGIGPGIEA